MKIVRFHDRQMGPQVGVWREGQIVLVTAEAGGSLATLIAGGERTLAAVRFAAGSTKSKVFDEGAVKLLAPTVPRPNIFGIGLNYKEHAVESKMQTQAVPTVFMKLASSIAGPGEDIILPNISTQPDYEAEFAAVIGRGGRNIAAEDWRQHVFGYTIVNDVSARDVQLATTQWTLGKSFPTFTPVGPCVVTADEIADPHELAIELTIDGEVLQQSNTRHLIFRVPELIAHLSSILPLEPGDMISTGTPQGVGMGRSPQRWLKPGESIAITVEGIGTLRNRTEAEA